MFHLSNKIILKKKEKEGLKNKHFISITCFRQDPKETLASPA